MKATLVVGAFLAAVLMASPLFAKVGEPIQGVPVGLGGDPASVVIAQTKTDSAGVAIFRSVKPGRYRLTIGAIFDRWVGAIFERWGGGPCPCAADIEIKAPGQAKADFTLTYNGQATKTAFFDMFTVVFGGTLAGNQAQTVTVTITKVGAGQLQLPRS